MDGDDYWIGEKGPGPYDDSHDQDPPSFGEGYEHDGFDYTGPYLYWYETHSSLQVPQKENRDSVEILVSS